MSTNSGTASRRGPKSETDLAAMLGTTLRIAEDPILLNDSPLAAISVVQTLADQRYAAEGEYRGGYALRQLIREGLARLMSRTEPGCQSGDAVRLVADIAGGRPMTRAAQALGIPRSTAYDRHWPLGLRLLAHESLTSGRT